VSLRRTVRWVVALIAIIVGVLLVWVTVRFFLAYFSDKSQVNEATYLGTVVGCIGLLVVDFQVFSWLRRRESPESTATQLRAKTGAEIDRRLDDMSRTAEDITLTYRLSSSGQRANLNELIDALIKRSGRVVLTGQPGVGKSYTALQLAAALIRRDPSIVPLVIPLSRWTGTDEPTDRIARFLETEFNVVTPTAHELLRTDRVIPVFDGLDELCAEESAVEPAAELLAALIDWRILGTRVTFFLTCRRSTWDRINDQLTSHYSLAVFSIMAVNRDQARQYLTRSMGGADQTRPADELIRSLQQKGNDFLLTSPWQLSLMAEIASSQLNQSGQISAADLEWITNLATVDNLIAHYVESWNSRNRWAFTRIRQALDYWWLSNYARYLENNRIQSRVIAGRVLPARDLVLHRLWPAAGDRSPRIVDLMMCVTLSVPGFYWASLFLWSHGLPARIVLIVFGVVWTSLLVRTSTKPWVRPAMPKWSRLNDPKFFLRQLGAAVLIGVAAWLIVGPIAATVCFVTAWLAIGLTVGFGQTLATDVQPKVVGPLGILRRERQVSRFSAAVVFPVLAAGFSSTWGVGFGIGAALVYCLVVGETVACALWRRYLAMIIASVFRLPPAPARCLKRMHALGHVRIAGISYQFRHDDVLRYFAQRDGLRARTIWNRRRSST
jgi:NACHT domain-containing protein